MCKRCSLGDRLADLLVLCPFTDLKTMTRQRFIFSECIQFPVAALMAIATVPSVAPRCWMPSGLAAIASACIVGSSILPTIIPAPDCITKMTCRMAYANSEVGSAPWKEPPSVFRPADDLGLPNRREPGGTR